MFVIFLLFCVTEITDNNHSFGMYVNGSLCVYCDVSCIYSRLQLQLAAVGQSPIGSSLCPFGLYTHNCLTIHLVFVDFRHQFIYLERAYCVIVVYPRRRLYSSFIYCHQNIIVICLSSRLLLTSIILVVVACHKNSV